MGAQGQEILHPDRRRPGDGLGFSRRASSLGGGQRLSICPISIERAGAPSKLAPERAAGAARRHDTVDDSPVGLGKPGQRAERRRQHAVDLRADKLRQHGAGTFSADRHGDRRAVDDRRGVEVAQLGTVDRIDADAGGPGVLDDAAVGCLVACRREHHRGIVEQFGPVGFGDPRNAVGLGPLRERRPDVRRNDLETGARLRQEARLGQRLGAAADDDHATARHPHENGEGVQLRSRGGRVSGRMCIHGRNNAGAGSRSEGMHSRPAGHAATIFPPDAGGAFRCPRPLPNWGTSPRGGVSGWSVGVDPGRSKQERTNMTAPS